MSLSTLPPVPTVSVKRRAKSVLSVDNSDIRFQINVIPSEWRFNTAMGNVQGDHVSAEVLILESLCSGEGMEVSKIYDHYIKMAESLFSHPACSRWGSLVSENKKDATKVKEFLENFGTKFVQAMNLIPTMTHEKFKDEDVIAAIKEDLIEKIYDKISPRFAIEQHYWLSNKKSGGQFNLKDWAKNLCSKIFDISGTLEAKIEDVYNTFFNSPLQFAQLQAAQMSLRSSSSGRILDDIFSFAICANDNRIDKSIYDAVFTDLSKLNNLKKNSLDTFVDALLPIYSKNPGCAPIEFYGKCGNITKKAVINWFKINMCKAVFRKKLISDRNSPEFNKSVDVAINSLEMGENNMIVLDGCANRLFDIYNNANNNNDKKKKKNRQIIKFPEIGSLSKESIVKCLKVWMGFNNIDSNLVSTTFLDSMIASSAATIKACYEYQGKVIKTINEKLISTTTKNLEEVAKHANSDSIQCESVLTGGAGLLDWLKENVSQKKSSESQGIQNLRSINRLMRPIPENVLGSENPNEIAKKIISMSTTYSKDSEAAQDVNVDFDIERIGLVNYVGDNIFKLFDFPFIDNNDDKDASRPSNKRQFEILCEVASRHMVLIYHTFPSFQKLNKDIREAIHNRFLEHILTKGLWNKYQITSVTANNPGVPLAVDSLREELSKYADLSVVGKDGCYKMKPIENKPEESEQVDMLCYLWWVIINNLHGEKNGGLIEKFDNEANFTEKKQRISDNLQKINGALSCAYRKKKVIKEFLCSYECFNKHSIPFYKIPKKEEEKKKICHLKKDCKHLKGKTDIAITCHSMNDMKNEDNLCKDCLNYNALPDLNAMLVKISPKSKSKKKAKDSIQLRYLLEVALAYYNMDDETLTLNEDGLKNLFMLVGVNYPPPSSNHDISKISGPKIFYTYDNLLKICLNSRVSNKKFLSKPALSTFISNNGNNADNEIGKNGVTHHLVEDCEILAKVDKKLIQDAWFFSEEGSKDHFCCTCLKSQSFRSNNDIVSKFLKHAIPNI